MADQICFSISFIYNHGYWSLLMDLFLRFLWHFSAFLLSYLGHWTTYERCRYRFPLCCAWAEFYCALQPVETTRMTHSSLIQSNFFLLWHGRRGIEDSATGKENTICYIFLGDSFTQNTGACIYYYLFILEKNSSFLILSWVQNSFVPFLFYSLSPCVYHTAFANWQNCDILSSTKTWNNSNSKSYMLLMLWSRGKNMVTVSSAQKVPRDKFGRKMLFMGYCR